MSEKIARLGIERDNDMMYYIKNGDVWATPRKKPGQPKGKAQKIAPAGVEMDYSKYIYFLDKDGDIARKARASGGGRKTKAAKAPKAAKTSNGNGNGKPKKKKTNGTIKTDRSSITGHYVKAATAKRHPEATVEETRPSHKSEAQIARECDEIIAQMPAPPSAGARKKKGWF